MPRSLQEVSWESSLGPCSLRFLVGVWSLEMASSAWGSGLHPLPYASAEPFKGVTL